MENHVTMGNITKDLLHYGEILTDLNIGVHRIRTIWYGGSFYFHHMVRGEVVEIYKLKEDGADRL